MAKLKKVKRAVKQIAKKRIVKKVASEPVVKRLVLRNCNSDGSSYNGYVWNTEIGAVNTCPDWIDNLQCGNGLHGWLDGIGSANCSDYNSSPLWFVLEVEKFVDLGDKVKFPTCVVVFKGSKAECAKYLYDAGIRGPIIGLTGDYPEGGDYSALISEGTRTQKAGDLSTQKAGHSSTQTAGNYSTITCGNNCKVTAGIGSTVTHRWYDNGYKVAVFIITEKEANKQFLYKDGVQYFSNKYSTKWIKNTFFGRLFQIGFYMDME